MLAQEAPYADRHYPFRYLITEKSLRGLEVELRWTEWSLELQKGSWTGV